MSKQRGFSLIELLVVIVILGVIGAIAIPGLRRARQNAQSGSAIQSLRTITTAEHLYERRTKVYATLAQLAPEGTIDGALAAGSKSGYTFELALGPGSTSYTCTASPQEEPTVRDYFFVDETSVIRFTTGSPADVSSPPIPR